MAEDEEEFAAPAGAFITAGSKKAVVPSAAALAPQPILCGLC